MAKARSVEALALEKRRDEILAGQDAARVSIKVCGGTGCLALSSDEVAQAFEQEMKAQGVDGSVELKTTGCPGFCEQGPLLTIYPRLIFYTRVKPKDVAEIVSKTIIQGEVVDRLLYKDPQTGEKIVYETEVPFYKKQKRILLKNSGLIDPRKIEDYIAADGYKALEKALFEMTPEQVIAEVNQSGLRGRGGAGFATGVKWELCRNAAGDPKYIVCNADEGDPGAFQDRGLIEGNPHSILEGMIIGAYAIGAHQGFIYIRNEYPLAVELIRLAVEQARHDCLLGENILGSGFSFDVVVQLGAGAFVCGEETALMASIEGRTGEPRARPPYPAESGLWGQPTNINNTKTWAWVPHIIQHGADWFAQMGTEKSKGTTIFSVVGKVKNTGLVEVPMGISLRYLIEDIGGGVSNGKKLKAVQTGGPSGGCIPAKFLDTPVKYYSSGMYVRLAFAVAAHLEPEILVVDEVLAVGDAAFQKKCLGKMGDVAHQGRTVLFVSHNMVAIKGICARSILINSGKLQFDDESEVVVSNYLRNLSAENNASIREWGDFSNALGSGGVLLKRISINPIDENENAITTSSVLKCNFQFWNNLPNDLLNFSIILKTLSGIDVFNTVSTPISMPSGLIDGTFFIPSDFLNEGTYSIRVLIVKDKHQILLNLDDAIIFEVHDNTEHHGWYGKWPGVLHPKFDWAVSIIQNNSSFKLL